jgi:hypothetical protein
MVTNHSTMQPIHFTSLSKIQQFNNNKAKPKPCSLLLQQIKISKKLKKAILRAH